jgi:hypothetical protein
LFILKSIHDVIDLNVLTVVYHVLEILQVMLAIMPLTSAFVLSPTR